MIEGRKLPKLMGDTVGGNIIKYYIILQSFANTGGGGKDLNLRPSGYEPKRLTIKLYKNSDL